MHPVTISEEPERHVAALAHSGPDAEIGTTFEALQTRVAATGLASKTEGLVAVYPEPDTETDTGPRVYAGVVLAPHLLVPDGFTAVILPAGSYATCFHRGPHDGLGAIWTWLTEDWAAEAGEVPAETPRFELYLNRPSSTPRDQLETMLFLPQEEGDFNGPL